MHIECKDIVSVMSSFYIGPMPEIKSIPRDVCNVMIKNISNHGHNANVVILKRYDLLRIRYDIDFAHQVAENALPFPVSIEVTTDEICKCEK